MAKTPAKGDRLDRWAGGPAEAIDHFRRHGWAFGAMTAEDYVEKALAFYERARAEGLPVKVDPVDGTVRIYDQRTNTFGAYTPDGRPITLHKPTAGVRYWRRQPG